MGVLPLIASALGFARAAGRADGAEAFVQARLGMFAGVSRQL